MSSAKNPRGIWTVFAAGALAVAVGLLWLSLVVVRSEATALADRNATARQAQLRLALWRLDAWMGGFLAREAARPYTDYRPQGGAPSPLQDFDSEYVEMHFEIDTAGRLSSPGAAADNLTRLSQRLDIEELEHQITVAENLVVERLHTTSWPRFVPEFSRRAVAGAQCQTPLSAPVSYTTPLTLGTGPLLPLQVPDEQVPDEQVPDEVQVGPLIPLWLSLQDENEGDTTFVFVRRVATRRGDSFQGFLGAWQVLRPALVAQVADLFPQAELVPVTQVELDAEPEALLATLPAALQVTAPPVAATSLWTSTRLKLALVWLAAAIAAVAVAVTLRANIELSARRQRFAGAVAHELRTPLTTFQMYTEMLADGTVQGEQERQEYLDILKNEAQRLSGLVQNVLTYAGLEEQAKPRHSEPLSLEALLDRLVPPLDRQVEAAGLRLDVEGAVDDPAPLVVDVELIAGLLLNLVDNACKYAAPNGSGSAEAAVLWLDVHLMRRQLILRLRDHGPGVPESEAREIFEPFSRGTRQKAEPAPGIGLGLALARGLARSSGGDLTLIQPAGPGACFELRLPVSLAPSTS